MARRKLQPSAERLVVQVQKGEEKTDTGIYLPSSAVEKTGLATVISVGEDVGVAVEGNTVVYAKYAGTEIKFDGEEYLIIESDDVLATVEGEDA